MLVLSRKPMETVVIGGTDGSERLLKVTVLEIKNGSVRLGFDVADEVNIRCFGPYDQFPNTRNPGQPASEYAPLLQL